MHASPWLAFLLASCAIAACSSCITATTPVIIQPVAIPAFKPHPITVSFQGSTCSHNDSWELSFGELRVPADFAFNENGTVVLSATAPRQARPLTVDVKVIQNLETVLFSPQALVCFGPYTVYDATATSKTSLQLLGHNLPILATKPTINLRVSLVSSVSPVLLALVVTNSSSDTVSAVCASLSSPISSYLITGCLRRFLWSWSTVDGKPLQFWGMM